MLEKKWTIWKKKDKPKLNVSRFNGHGNTRQQKEMNDNNWHFSIDIRGPVTDLVEHT